MAAIEEIKRYFKDLNLLDQAFTHRSWVNENPGIRSTNERLEFLGDAILEFVVSEFIYKLLPDKEEGYLTALRSNVVNTKNLAKFALEANLGENLYLSKGEDNGGGRQNPALLADTVEAIIGAIYIDNGLNEAKEFIQNNLLSDIKELMSQPLKDPKSRLQEAVQAEGKNAPRYKVVKEEGPDHDKIFTVEVIVDDENLSIGHGSSKLKAEQAAAEAALVKFEQKK